MSERDPILVIIMSFFPTKNEIDIASFLPPELLMLLSSKFCGEKPVFDGSKS